LFEDWSPWRVSDNGREEIVASVRRSNVVLNVPRLIRKTVKATTILSMQIIADGGKPYISYMPSDNVELLEDLSEKATKKR